MNRKGLAKTFMPILSEKAWLIEKYLRVDASPLYIGRQVHVGLTFCVQT